MNFKDYNDFYLIYLIKEMHCEVSLKLMFEKYGIFIKKKIHSFKIRNIDYDDFYQEGLICLNKAIYSYNDKYKKTFYKYFDIFGEDRIKEANIKLQEEVTITFEIDAREYNGRWYNSFRLVTINREEKVKEELKDLPSDFYDSDDSTPPF